jgi:prephenate dehydrogenase
MLKKLVVCGVGLIGGSFALGLKAAGKVESVLGLGRTRGPLEEACRLGVIDRIADGWADALAGAELVLLATPVGQMEAVFTALAPHLGPGTIITDGGSTKTDVVAAARAGLGNKIGQFIPGHPIAGAEKSGVAAAKPDLYADRRVVLTPLAENSPADVARLQSIWEACGAKVSRLAPEEHDRVFAAVSHLPHLLAFALVHDLRNGRIRTSSSALPPVAFAISRASPAAIRRCGATSASPIAAHCCRNSMPTCSN